MSTKLIETLKGTVGDLSALNADKLKTLLDETLRFFQEMQEKMASPETQKREEALQSALELKQALEGQMELLLEQTGYDMSQMAALMETAQYSVNEKEVLDEIKSKLREFQKPMGEETPKRSAKRKAPKLRLIG